MAKPAFTPGDYFPNLWGTTPKGTPFRALTWSGKRFLAVFYGSDDVPGCKGLLQGLVDYHARFQDLGIDILSVSLNSPEERQQTADAINVPFELICDGDPSLSKMVGAMDNTDQYSRIAYLLDLNFQVVGVYMLNDDTSIFDTILDEAKQCFPSPTQARPILSSQAPILVIPKLFPKDFCKFLVDVWREKGNDVSAISRPTESGTQAVVDYGVKDRRDHILEEGTQLSSYIDSLMMRRLAPQVKKAFEFNLTNRGVYKVSGYNAETGGYFRAHRDNSTTATAHWRFALSINLNKGEYEGGYLNFLEYANGLYQLETGDAAVFSCSLLHEATPVTQGERFAFLGFFYGPKEEHELQEAIQRGFAYPKNQVAIIP